MYFILSHIRSKLVAVALVLAAVGVLSQPHFLPWQFQGGIAWAQSQGESNRDAPQITSLTHPTLSSITVNWQEADDTDAHWIYSVKSDGSGGHFQEAILDPPPSGGAGGQSGPVTGVSLSTTITGLESGTQYWFVVIGGESPSEGSPKEWFSWSNWGRGSTLATRSVSLGQDVSAIEGGTANVTVTANVAPQSALTVNYAIGTDADVATIDGNSDDYTGSATGSIVIAAEATQGVIPIVINDDSDIDDGTRETLVVTISLPEGSSYQLGDNTSATVTIKEGVCDRTAKVRNIILNSLMDISDCTDVTDADLSGITDTLDLSGRSITELKARDFRGLTALTTLRLNRNSLASLPVDVFDDLDSLTTLYLNSNSLASLPEDVFDDLTDLQYLRLSNNSLASLREDVFDDLSSLITLRLNNNSLASLPMDVFDGLDSLQVLYLNNNSLASLPEDVFDGLTGLQELYAQSNTGSPFTFTAELEQTYVSEVKIAVSDAVPFDMTVTLSVTGGTLPANSVVVPAGSDESSAITVTPSGDGPVAVSATATSFPISGVAVNGVTYKHNGIQPGVGAANQAPEAKAGADQTVATGAEVTLDASESNDSDTGDTLSYGWTQTAGATVTLSSSTASGPTFTAPSTATTLTFQVTVLDGRGGSDRDTVNITVVAPPAAPANLSATAGDGQITLNWDDPNDTGITGYEYRLKEGTNDWGDWAAIPNSGAATVEYVKTGLSNGTAYTVEVRAVNAGGKGESAQAEPVTPMGVPTNVRETADSTSSITWSWNAVFGASAYDYEYRIGTAGDADGSGSTTSTSRRITGLTSDTTYQIRVRSKQGDSVSAWSAWVSGTTAMVPPLPSVPSDLTIMRFSNDYIILRWSYSGVQATSYTVQYRIGAGSWSQQTSTYTIKTFVNLSPATSYEFRVRANNANGSSGWSSSVFQTTQAARPMPALPTIFYADSLTNGQLRMFINLEAQGEITEGRYKEVGTTSWYPISIFILSTAHADTLTLRVTTPVLISGRTYTMQVRRGNNDSSYNPQPTSYSEYVGVNITVH